MYKICRPLLIVGGIKKKQNSETEWAVTTASQYLIEVEEFVGNLSFIIKLTIRTEIDIFVNYFLKTSIRE